LYQQALIPKSSSINLPGKPIIHNERLEYLGDAILEAIISAYLFHKFPDKNEGYLTKLRSKFVQRDHLNRLGNTIELNKLVKPPVHHNRHKKNLNGDTLEAFIGAIYLDRGFAVARNFVIDTLIHKHTDFITLVNSDTDFKSKIIEWSQQTKDPVSFTTKEELNQSSNQSLFHTQLTIHDKIIGEGEGSSKREAEQNASESAIRTLGL
jgi:ribonuclease-3